MQISKFTLYATLYAVFNVAGATLIKHKLGASSVSSVRDFILFLMSAQTILALCLIVVSMFFSIKVLSLASFSAAVPYLTGINFILTLMVGIFIFSERLIPIGYIGVFLIFIGVVCVSMGYGQT